MVIPRGAAPARSHFVPGRFPECNRHQHWVAARKVAFAAKVHNACRVGYGPVHPFQLVMGDTSTLLIGVFFAAWWAAT
jgi:hypothetical protein